MQTETVSNEPSSDEMTREASTDLMTSPRTSSLQNVIHQSVAGMDDINNSGLSLPQHKQKTLAYHNAQCWATVNSYQCTDDNGVTVISHQPEENRYVSISHTSLHKGDEKMVMGGPLFCEGLSGNIDDYSDYVIPINYCMPEIPQSIMLEESPLVIQDGYSQATTIPVLTTTVGHGTN